MLSYECKSIIDESRKEMMLILCYDCKSVVDETRKEMMLMLCYECKSWGPHACMCVICIRILPHYVMIVLPRTFDIYVRCDIMRAFPFFWHLVTH